MERKRVSTTDLCVVIPDILIQQDILAWVYFEMIERESQSGDIAVFEFLETAPYELLQELIPKLDLSKFTIKEIPEEHRSRIRGKGRFDSYSGFIDYIKHNYYNVKVSLTDEGIDLLESYNKLVECLEEFDIYHEILVAKSTTHTEKLEVAILLGEVFGYYTSPIPLEDLTESVPDPILIAHYIEFDLH